MAEKTVRLRVKATKETLALPESQWKKFDDERRADYDELGTEEEEQKALIEQSIADSKRYDAAVKTKKGEEPSPEDVKGRVGEAPPPEVNTAGTSTGLTTDAIANSGEGSK